ncbi:MAG: hypothetical protein BGP06_02315 [Rhizobiales bacterium 65-9]|nr:hypothetical protein [Hyphomicrobiales bacterium]OJY34309.1 MAG: hypothetical protein BGP06_02315 [Rhizobiales bacterium 65-9]
MTTADAPSARRVTTAEQARALLTEIAAVLDRLEKTLLDETELMQSGRINEGLALSPRKQDEAGLYMRLLESVKANAVALARFAPEGVESLKTRHGVFAQQLHLNQTVIATVKSVSESLVRGLQVEATSRQTLSVYGPGAAPVAASTAARSPLALSVRL